MTSAEPIRAEPVPLRWSEDGSVLRVAGTRVTLDTVVNAFQQGATAEEIVQDYTVLRLVDVYAVIAYYLQHRAEVEFYLERRARQHRALRQEIEGRPEHRQLRARLLARDEERSKIPAWRQFIAETYGSTADAPIPERSSWSRRNR